jgi:Transposase DDE domain group 1
MRRPFVVVDSRLRASGFTHSERPFPMRWRRADLRGRVNGNLRLRFEHKGLTSYAGLEFVRRYFSMIGLMAMLRRELGRAVPRSDFGAPTMVLVILALLMSGGRRLRHLLYLEDDPIVLRFCGLRRLPTAHTVGRWLREFRTRHLPRLQWLNSLIAARAIRQALLRRLTIDVDGSVVSTGLQVQWAQRGFNPHRRKVPSYYPITAYEAQSGQVLRVQNRPGNVHDGKAALGFLRDLFTQIATTLGAVYELEFRMDGAFFRREIIALLEHHRAEYAIKVPFYPWTGLKAQVQQTQVWSRVDSGVSCAEHRVEPARWGRRLRVVVYRRRVHHETAKNFQLDLFDPSNGTYEYSAVVTNKLLGGQALWAFICGRGVHEKVYGELKRGFAFDCVPTMRYAANSAWQLLSVLAFNLMRGFQMVTTAERRARTRKRRSRFRFEAIHTLRYLCLNRAGALVRPDGYPTLDVGRAHGVIDRFKRLDRLLKAA